MKFTPISALPDITTIRVVSWDVDGTLYSTRQAAWHVTRRATRVAAASCRLDPFRELSQLVRLWRRVEAARHDPGAVDSLLAGSRRRIALEGRWWAPAMAASGPRSGVRSVLEYFRTRVEAQVILTDYEAGYKLRSLGLEGYFDAEYVGEQMECFKPSPMPYARILADFDLAPECLLHIGDRVDTDGWGATAAGCRSLLLRKDFPSFGELYRMLESNTDGESTL